MMGHLVKSGDRVKTGTLTATVAQMSWWPWHSVVMARRRPDTAGEVVGGLFPYGPLFVKHDDDTTAPYLPDELGPWATAKPVSSIRGNEWVRTARVLSRLVTFDDEYLPLRRANALGVVVEDEDETGGYLTVRHVDGTEAPYESGELTPSASFYIASKTRHATRWRALRGVGVPIVSTWIDEAGEGESTDLSDLWKRCISEASSAAVCVVYVESGETLKGALVEVGAALASGREVRWVGTPVSQTLMSHPAMRRFETVEEAFGLPALGLPVPVASPRVPFPKGDEIARHAESQRVASDMGYRDVAELATSLRCSAEGPHPDIVSATRVGATGRAETDAEWFAAEDYASTGVPPVLLTPEAGRRAWNAAYGASAGSAESVHVAALRRLVTAFDGDGPDFSEALTAAKVLLAGYPIPTVEEQLAEVRRALVAADAAWLAAKEDAEDTADIAKRFMAHARALAEVARLGVRKRGSWGTFRDLLAEERKAKRP